MQRQEQYYSVIWSKLCLSFKGMQFCNNDLNQNSVSFMHMSNAYLKCFFKFQVSASNTFGGVAETTIVLQCDMVQTMSVIQGDVILQ